jgi:8-oxo-dGTP diphosphatase
MKQVVCALIVNDGKLLITQHGMHSGHPFQWEFPGGKIKSGEQAELALIREVYEELLIEVSIDLPLEPVIYQYPGKEINLMPFLCSWVSGEIQLMEHYDFRWIEPRSIFDYDMLPADFEMLNRGDNLIRLLHYAREQTEESRKQNTPAHN